MVFDNVKIKDVKASVGTLIKLFRKKNGITQKELSVALDLSRITIQNVEAGKNYTIDTLLKILQHLDLLEELNNEITEVIEDNKNIKSLY